MTSQSAATSHGAMRVVKLHLRRWGGKVASHGSSINRAETSAWEAGAGCAKRQNGDGERVVRWERHQSIDRGRSNFAVWDDEHTANCQYYGSPTALELQGASFPRPSEPASSA